MASDKDSMKKELDALILQGNRLYLSMIDDVQGLPDDFKEELKEKKIKLPDFKKEYHSWYSE